MTSKMAVNVLLDVGDYEKLKTIAERNGRSMASEVRRMVQGLIKKSKI